MTIDDILKQWQEDSNIDKTELGDENIKIPKLHHKYYSILSNERLRLRKLESEYKQLKLEKYEYFSQGASQEHIEKGWKPLSKMIIKSEVPMYMEADDQIIEMNLKISYQQEKIDLLTDIMKMVHNRTFQLKNVQEWQRFIMGG